MPLPPRTRGRLHNDDPSSQRHASTPAHAGPTTMVGERGGVPCLYPRARGADLLSTVEILRHPSSRAPLLIHSQPIGPLRHEPHAVQDDRAGNRPIEDDGEMSSTARLAGIGAD